ALQADLDERRLHAGHDPLHLALVDVADHAARPAAFDVQLLQHAVLDHGHARFAGGHVDQDFLGHGVTGASPSATDSRGSTRITPTWRRPSKANVPSAFIRANPWPGACSWSRTRIPPAAARFRTAAAPSPPSSCPTGGG